MRVQTQNNKNQAPLVLLLISSSVTTVFAAAEVYSRIMLGAATDATVHFTTHTIIPLPSIMVGVGRG